MKKNNIKKTSSVMWLWVVPVIFGFALLLSGLGAAFILDLKVLSIAISGSMFLSGLFGVIYFFANNKRFGGLRFYIILAILDFVLATLLIRSSEIQVTTIVTIVSFWILFQGLGKIIYSLDIQKLGIRSWDLDLILGILFISYGAINIFLMPLSPAMILLITAIVLSFSGLFQISLSLARKAEYKSHRHDIEIEAVNIG
jgi:uncharacterized membrane protein HdeD (DUF308 family)